MEVGDTRLDPTLRRALDWLAEQAGARRGRRLGGGAARVAAGRLGLPVREPALPRSRRHRRGRAGARPLRRGALPRGDRSRRRMGRRHAEPQWRLGLVRRRQHALLPEPHPVRRSRRAARPADRRCQRPLRRLSGAARHRRRIIPALATGARLSARASRRPTAAGSAAGAPTTSTAPGRCWPRSTPPASIRTAPEMRRAVAWLLARQRDGWRLGRERRELLAGCAARRWRRTAPRRRPPGRCSG